VQNQSQETNKVNEPINIEASTTLLQPCQSEKKREEARTLFHKRRSEKKDTHVEDIKNFMLNHVMFTYFFSCSDLEDM